MGHYATDKMSLRARETVYWPGISEDIRHTYHHCHICAKFARTQQRETLQFIETPQTAWEQLGLYIFTLRNIQYLLVIDYFSWFPVVRQLQSLHSLSVIKHLKDIFTEIGIPRCIVSDGGTQFTSQEFQDFTRTWGIHHRVTSPTNAQSNGQAERFVQTIKNSLTKAMVGGEDPLLSIITYTTTPLNHSLPSPAELLNSRKYRCILPIQVKQQNLTHKYRNIMQKHVHLCKAIQCSFLLKGSTFSQIYSLGSIQVIQQLISTLLQCINLWKCTCFCIKLIAHSFHNCHQIGVWWLGMF